MTVDRLCGRWKIGLVFLFVLVLLGAFDDFSTTPPEKRQFEKTSSTKCEVIKKLPPVKKFETTLMDRLREDLMSNSSHTALAGFNAEYPPKNELDCSFKVTHFDPPKVQLADFVRAEGGEQVFLVGDSVIGQLCLLGLPGLCCNSRVLCPNTTQPLIITNATPDLTDWKRPYATGTHDWQHLDEFVARGADEISPAYVPVYQFGPNAASFEDGGAHLIHNALYKNAISADSPFPCFEITKGDVLIVGLFGNHFHQGPSGSNMMSFRAFADIIIKEVVNPFPGRVVLLGYSPQHFTGNGEYHNNTSIRVCGPFRIFDGIDAKVGEVELRSAIWSNAIFEHLNHPRSRFVDTNQFLSMLWMCHRVPGGEKPDCTHWHDTVYSILALAVLNALGTLE